MGHGSGWRQHQWLDFRCLLAEHSKQIAALTLCCDPSNYISIIVMLLWPQYRDGGGRQGGGGGFGSALAQQQQQQQLEEQMRLQNHR